MTQENKYKQIEKIQSAASKPIKKRHSRGDIARYAVMTGFAILAARGLGTDPQFALEANLPMDQIKDTNLVQVLGCGAAAVSLIKQQGKLIGQRWVDALNNYTEKKQAARAAKKADKEIPFTAQRGDGEGGYEILFQNEAAKKQQSKR